MGTPSKTGNLDANGALKVSLAADTAVATTYVDVTNTAQKLPGTPLENRREMIIAFPTDFVFLGPSGIDNNTGYGTRGRKGGTTWDYASAIGDYSSRRQFLRGQYATLRVTDDLGVYGVNNSALESVVVLELS